MLDDRFRALSPLALLGLAACNGSGGGGAGSGRSSGSVVDGPLARAIVWLDDDGTAGFSAGDSQVRTTDTGTFDIANPNNLKVNVKTDAQTFDIVTGHFVGEMEFSSSHDDGVITPLDALSSDAATMAKVATALNLDGVDLNTFNPYADDSYSATDVTGEQVTQQLVGTAQIIGGALEGVGLAQNGFGSAFTALADAIVAEANAGRTVDFSDATFVRGLLDGLGLGAELNAAQMTSLVGQITGTNTAIGNVTDIGSSDATAPVFSTATTIADAYADAATASDSDAALAAANAIDAQQAAKEEIPGAASISTGGTFREVMAGDTSRVVGTLSADGATRFEISGEDAALLTVSGDQLLVRDGVAVSIDDVASLDFTVKALSNSGKSSSTDLSVSVENVDQAGTGSVTVFYNTSVDVVTNATTEVAPVEGELLSVDIKSLADHDNLINDGSASDFASVAYQWYADGTAITGATDKDLRLTSDHVGKELSVKVTTTDKQGGTTEFKSVNDLRPITSKPLVEINFEASTTHVGEAVGQTMSSLSNGMDAFGDKLQNNMDNIANGLMGREPDNVQIVDGNELRLEFNATDQSNAGRIDIELSGLDTVPATQLLAALNSLDLSDPSSWTIEGVGIESITFRYEKADGNDERTKISFREDSYGGDQDVIAVSVGSSDDLAAGDVKDVALIGEFSTDIGDLLTVIGKVAAIKENTPDAPDPANFVQSGSNHWVMSESLGAAVEVNPEAFAAALTAYDDATQVAISRALVSVLKTQDVNGFFVSLKGGDGPTLALKWDEAASHGDSDAIQLRIGDFNLSLWGELPDTPEDLDVLLNLETGPLSIIKAADGAELTGAQLTALVTSLKAAGLESIEGIELSQKIEAAGSSTNQSLIRVDFAETTFENLVLGLQNADVSDLYAGKTLGVNDDGQHVLASYIATADNKIVMLSDAIDLETALGLETVDSMVTNENEVFGV